MTATWPDESVTRPFAPPLQASVPAPSAPTWPMVLGIIAIIIGGIGILYNGCGGLLAPVIQTQVAKMVPPGSDPMLDAQMKVTQKYLWFQIANAIALFALGIVLLIAGIGLIRRRPWARGLSLLWAWLRIVVTVPASWLGYRIAVETMQAIVDASNSGASGAQQMPAGMTNFFQAFGIAVVVLGTVMVCACPIFTIIWFSRGKIKAEVATWGAPQVV